MYISSHSKYVRVPGKNKKIADIFLPTIFFKIALAKQMLLKGIDYVHNSYNFTQTIAYSV